MGGRGSAGKSKGAGGSSAQRTDEILPLNKNVDFYSREKAKELFHVAPEGTTITVYDIDTGGERGTYTKKGDTWVAKSPKNLNIYKVPPIRTTNSEKVFANNINYNSLNRHR